MGSMLVLFVPAQCGNRHCNPLENLIHGTNIHLCAAAINILTFACFLLLGATEFRRENWLNHYLVANPHLPMEPDAFGAKLSTLTVRRRNNLLNILLVYQRIACATLALYVLNIGFSAYVIFTSYLDNKTPISIVTNVLLVGSKLYDVYHIAYAGPYVFLSAYKRQHVQYNDVNPNKILHLRAPEPNDTEKIQPQASPTAVEKPVIFEV
jgi:hypothetical protein